MNTITSDGKCSNCGSDDFTLAEEVTEYSRVTLQDGVWVRKVWNVECTGGETRFFCAKCMTYHTAPEDIE